MNSTCNLSKPTEEEGVDQEQPTAPEHECRTFGMSPQMQDFWEMLRTGSQALNLDVLIFEGEVVEVKEVVQSDEPKHDADSAPWRDILHELPLAAQRLVLCENARLTGNVQYARGFRQEKDSAGTVWTVSGDPDKQTISLLGEVESSTYTQAKVDVQMLSSRAGRLEVAKRDGEAFLRSIANDVPEKVQIEAEEIKARKESHEKVLAELKDVICRRDAAKEIVDAHEPLEFTFPARLGE